MKKSIKSILTLFVTMFCIFAHSATETKPKAIPLVDWSLINHMFLSFGVILVALFLLRILLNKAKPMSVNKRLQIHVVGGISIGPKERVVAIDIGKTRLYLAICTNHISVIHQMEIDEESGITKNDEKTFRHFLKKKN